MSNISQVDKNFCVESKLNIEGLRYHFSLEKPFVIDGVFKENGRFRRIPESVAKTVSQEVYQLHGNTAGGRVRFQTDSSYVAISVKLDTIAKMPHFALTGAAGFDLYSREDGEWQYQNTFIPPYEGTECYESVIRFDAGEMREIVINFPLYADVLELWIGLEQDARIEAPLSYAKKERVVYYGSSITQGGCASRPGNSYPAILGRRFDCDYLNLGFSGSAKAEKTMSDYIKNLDMGVFVYDYDYNAPNLEHLKQTHERMFREIREANPNLPIIMMSRPQFRTNDGAKQRLEIIQETYRQAKASGDENVYLITGRELMAFCEHDGTVDTIHPNDFGFYSMAKAVEPVLKKVFK